MARPLAWWSLAVVLGAGFHAVEHVVQAVQKYAIAGAHPHGLLGVAVGNDPMHFAYNALFLVALVPVLRVGGAAGNRWSWGLFTGGVLLQAFHVVEHTAKLAQWMAGASTARGLLGQHFELVPLHLALNSAVYLLVAPQLVAWARQTWASAGASRAGALKTRT